MTYQNYLDIERAPHLDERGFLAILQSIAQQELGRGAPLARPARPPREFGAGSWQDAGCDADVLRAISERYARMFHVRLDVPDLAARAEDLADTALRLWREGARPITFFTSGSTGMPKPCTHLEAHLRQEITSIAPLLTGRRAALVTAPMHHMYGFTFGLLLPLTLDIPIRSCPPLPTVVFAQMRPGDMVVGIPLLWTRLVDVKGWAGQSSGEGEDIALISATAPLPAQVMSALMGQAFRVVEFFGASEMGAVCRRERPDMPFVLLPHVRRGTHNGEDVLQRLLPDGELRSYPLLDNVAWMDHHSFYPQGRRDKAVQIGGVNVFPDHVAEVLQGHEGVRECSVRLMRPEEGHRLKAFVVPAPGWTAEALRPALSAFVRKRLEDVLRPAAYAFGEELPCGPVGKPSDW
ncbi:MAG: AMP-binding protein [Desulfovibrio sp.]|nr:AMP-binding protein [Desulfovibrio sp.]